LSSNLYTRPASWLKLHLAQLVSCMSRLSLASDLKDGVVADWIVCGWFTDDLVYRPLAEQLAANLEAIGAPYDFVSVPRIPGGWETNTLAKAEQALAAVNRHPDKTIILMDIDYTATGDISWLAHSPGDVAMQMGARRRKNGSTRLAPSAQILVFKPNEAARRFIEAWIDFGRKPLPGDTSEAFLTLACAVPEVSISSLNMARVGSVLVHSRASRHGPRRMSGLRRGVACIFGSVARRHAFAP
jgi:hypothetical protein